MKGCPASAKSVVVEVKNFTAKKVVRYPQPSVRERTPLVFKAVIFAAAAAAEAAPAGAQGGAAANGRTGRRGIKHLAPTAAPRQFMAPLAPSLDRPGNLGRGSQEAPHAPQKKLPSEVW